MDVAEQDVIDVRVGGSGFANAAPVPVIANPFRRTSQDKLIAPGYVFACPHKTDVGRCANPACHGAARAAWFMFGMVCSTPKKESP